MRYLSKQGIEFGAVVRNQNARKKPKREDECCRRPQCASKRTKIRFHACLQKETAALCMNTAPGGLRLLRSARFILHQHQRIFFLITSAETGKPFCILMHSISPWSRSQQYSMNACHAGCSSSPERRVEAASAFCNPGIVLLDIVSASPVRACCN